VLLVDRLNGVAPGSVSGAPTGLALGAAALANKLKSMTLGARLTLFRGLVNAANRPAGLTASTTSGEIGFYTVDAVAPALGKAAFATTTRTGDVIGPVVTPAGSALYLIETRYAGALDTRSQTALGQIRSDPAANPLTYTQVYSPSDSALALDAGWRAEAEFGSGEAVHSALFDTPIGILSDPFVLDGKLALASVTERRTALPDARMLDRLRLDGYDVWFASQYATATITESAHPLPELEPSSSPSASASTSVGPILPSAPALDTPNIPSIPGAPAATPVPTDAMGLPEVP
jgi:hypothetical protein